MRKIISILIFLVIISAQFSYGAESARLITVLEGIKMVLKDSRLVNIELAGKDMSFEDTIAALSPLLPHLNISMTKTYNRYVPTMIFGSTNVPMGDKDPLAWSFDVYQTLFDFGKSISDYKASTEAFHARKANVESVKRTVTLEFIISYFDLLESGKMITVAEKEVESLTSYLNDMGHLYEQGVIVKRDLLAAQVKLADAKQKLIASHNYKEVAAARLNTMLTLPLTGNITVEDVGIQMPQLPEMGDAWKTAETQRPEIVFFNDRIKSSILREKAKTVRSLPVAFVNAVYSYTQNQYMVHPDESYFILGARADLYDGGVTGAEIMKERYMQKQLGEQKNKLVDDIRYEVKESYLSVTNAVEKLNVAKDALAQSEENVRFYRVKYNNGAATSTDVLEAISLQTKAETNYYNAEYELKRSYARLTYSIGDDLASIYKRTEK